METATPIIAGDERIFYDRNDDYFAYARLMEKSDIVLAEVDGQVAAVHSAAFHRALIGGRPVSLNYIHHLRILPGSQGRGVLPLLKKVAVPRYPPGQDGSYAYVDVRNTSVSARMEPVPDYHRWRVRPMMYEFDTGELAGENFGRTASREDIKHIVELLDLTHGAKDMWPAVQPDWFDQRLNRSPDDYSLADIRFSDHAVIGVWPAGRTFRVVTEGPSGRKEVRPGIVLDYGFERDGADEFLQLFRSRCRELASVGIDAIRVFATDLSPLPDAIGRLAASTRAFEFWTVRLVEPDDGDGRRDIYIDPIYF